MVTVTPQDWLDVAEANLVAGLALGERGSWRSASSRAYYAAHNAAQAITLHISPRNMPDRGNHPHGALPGELRRALRQFGRLGDLRIDQLRLALVEAYNIRVLADYKPGVLIEQGEFAAARSAARQAINIARGLLR